MDGHVWVDEGMHGCACQLHLETLMHLMGYQTTNLPTLRHRHYSSHVEVKCHTYVNV